MDKLEEWGVEPQSDLENLHETIRDYNFGFVGNYVENAKRLTDAPAIFHVGSALVLLSGLIGPAIRVGDSQLTLWVLLLGMSGRARKSTCLKLVERLLYAANKENVVPVHFSLQSLIDLFAAADERLRGLILPYDEFGQFLRRYTSIEMLSGVGETLIKAYDGSPLGYAYKQSGTKMAYNPYLSFIATGVPETLGKDLSRDALSSGFLARWLLLMPSEEEMSREKLSPFDRESDFDGSVVRHAMQITSWYERVVQSSSKLVVRAGGEEVEVNLASAKQLSMDAAAKEVISGYWMQVEDRIEQGIGRLGEGQAESLARARERASKIAALLTIGDGPPEGHDLPIIREKHAAAGVLLSDWFERRRAQAVDKLTMHFERRMKSIRVLPAMRRLSEKGKRRSIGRLTAPWFRRTEIQAEANMGKRTTRNALGDLVEDGTVIRVQVHGGKGMRGVYYALAIEIVEETEAPHPGTFLHRKE